MPFRLLVFDFRSVIRSAVSVLRSVAIQEKVPCRLQRGGAWLRLLRLPTPYRVTLAGTQAGIRHGSQLPPISALQFASLKSIPQHEKTRGQPRIPKFQARQRAFYARQDFSCLVATG